MGGGGTGVAEKSDGGKCEEGGTEISDVAGLENTKMDVEICKRRKIFGALALGNDELIIF